MVDEMGSTVWRRRPSARTAVGAILAIAAGLAVGAALVAVVATTLLGYRVLDIASGSMEPALRRGDLIVSRPAPMADVKTGDVVVFTEGTQQPVLLAHRVVAVNTLSVRATSASTGAVSVSTTYAFRTRGDANPGPDGWLVDAARYRGVVWLVVPSVGLPLLSLPLATIFLSVTITTAVLWVAYEVIRLARRRRARSKSSGASDA